LLLMSLWVLMKSESMTSVVSLLVGIVIFLYMRRPHARKRVKYLGTYSLTLVMTILLLNSVFALSDTILGVLGRSATLTGRTELWSQVLKETINPLIGAGYQSFWLGPILETYWNLWNFRPNQAHNGYLETYLNGGLIGVCFLMVMIVSAGRKLKIQLLQGSDYAILRFSFFAAVLFCNLTEAYFNRMTPMWFIMLLASMTYPHQKKTIDST